MGCGFGYKPNVKESAHFFAVKITLLFYILNLLNILFFDSYGS